MEYLSANYIAYAEEDLANSDDGCGLIPCPQKDLLECNKIVWGSALRNSVSHALCMAMVTSLEMA